MRLAILFVLVLSSSGCLATIPYWVRRAVVHDDWVYVKSTGKYYRRYIPDGIRLGGNKALLDAAGGDIIGSNSNIVLYDNYEEARDGKDITDAISAESVIYIRPGATEGDVGRVEKAKVQDSELSNGENERL